MRIVHHDGFDSVRWVRRDSAGALRSPRPGTLCGRSGLSNRTAQTQGPVTCAQCSILFDELDQHGAIDFTASQPWLPLVVTDALVKVLAAHAGLSTEPHQPGVRRVGEEVWFIR